MRHLLSKRVLTVSAEDRATDVSADIIARRASHCVVLDEPGGEFLGVVRLEELATKPESRIFADLISTFPELRLNRKATSGELLARLEQERLEEAVVLSPSGSFIGLVTHDSLDAWHAQHDLPRVNQATELAAKVRQQAALLREVVAQLDEFSYAIAHEMRAPLRAVRGYALTLDEDYGQRLDETARDYLRRIVRASERLDRLTLGVIAYREVAQRKLRIRRVDTAKLVGEIVEITRLQHPSAIIAVDTLPPVQADEVQLRGCIAQLIDNALKFSAASREPQIRIFAEKVGPTVTLCVQDNGIGVRAEHQARIFQLFEQVHGGREDSSYGVGLALVRKAVERMRGVIALVSDGKTGSCFRITLPA
ncbi:MAG TPA: ATP-binding protein [Opitutaceae bacterium]